MHCHLVLLAGERQDNVFVELSCGKKRTLYLIWGTERNYFGGNEGVKGGRGKGGRVKGGRREGGRGRGGVLPVTRVYF